MEQGTSDKHTKGRKSKGRQIVIKTWIEQGTSDNYKKGRKSKGRSIVIKIMADKA